MRSDEQIVYDAIIIAHASKIIRRVLPIHCLSIELEQSVRFDRDRMTEALSGLQNEGKIVIGDTVNHKYYRLTENAKRIMEHFEIVIKSFLDEKAKKDEAFAKRLAIESKSMKECCEYIISEIRKKAKGAYAACTDEEVYGLAIHYWDEDNIKVDTQTQASVVVNRELTPEEKDQADELKKQRQAMEEEEKRLRKEEQEKKRAEDAKRKKQEEAKAKRKKQEEEGLLFLFDDID